MQAINYKLVGQKIKLKRKKLGLTQEKLAERCDISVSYVAHIERGTKSLSLETAVKISNALQMSLDFLLIDELNGQTHVLNALDTELSACTPEQSATILRIAGILVRHAEEL